MINAGLYRERAHVRWDHVVSVLCLDALALALSCCSSPFASSCPLTQLALPSAPACIGLVHHWGKLGGKGRGAYRCMATAAACWRLVCAILPVCGRLWHAASACVCDWRRAPDRVRTGVGGLGWIAVRRRSALPGTVVGLAVPWIWWWCSCGSRRRCIVGRLGHGFSCDRDTQRHLGCGDFPPFQVLGTDQAQTKDSTCYL